MRYLDLQILSGDYAGMSAQITSGTYRVVRRASDAFEVRSTLVSSMIEQWQLSQEDLEFATANVAQRASDDGSALLSIDAYERQDDLAVWDQRMSQPHAMVMVDENSAMLVDMGSRNGSYVNGERVGASPLEDGDLLRFGATRVHVHIR